MWILCMTSSLSSHSTSASVSELSRLVTHTAVSSPKCNSEKRPLSYSVAFQTLFKWHRYCGILKIHIVRKINTGIRYEPVYRPALYCTLLFLLYAPSFWNALIFTKLIIQRCEACSDWPAVQCIVIGRIHQPCDRNFMYHIIMCYCDGVSSQRDETKTIKPIINEAFVACSGDIITDYNDLYCLFTLPCLHLWSEKWQTSTTLHSSKLNLAEMYLQAASQKRQTVLAKLELPPFIETAFVQAYKQGHSPASPP